MDDRELARRSIRGFAAMAALLDGAGTGNPWVDAAVGEGDAHTVWAEAEAVPGRVEDPSIAMPVLGLELKDAGPPDAALAVEVPPPDVIGAMNDRAYDQGPVLEPLIVAAAGDPRLRPLGTRVDGEWACVLLGLRVDDDLAVHYVATEARFRRRGLASRLVLAALDGARREGALTATLQASPDGLPVYERLGFRRVATLRAFQRA
jgi:GNAT superfamily N-acetyltransferase